MRKLFYITVLIIIGSSSTSFARQTNIEFGVDGQIGEIHYQNISKEYRATILAQLVSDDIIKKAKHIAKAGNYLEAHQLLSSITYLDYNNLNALEMQGNYVKEVAKGKSKKSKLYNNFISEANNIFKARKSSHNIDFKRGLIIAKVARSLYQKDTEEYKNANDIVLKINDLIRVEDPSQEIIEKLSNNARKAVTQKQYIKAINEFSTLFYAENSTMPLIEIVKLLKLIQ